MLTFENKILLKNSNNSIPLKSNNEKITELSNLYYPISFKAKVPKIIPSAEEIAKRQALEFKAIAERKVLPAILQILHPLPVSSGIKAKHVNQINENIMNDSFLVRFPKFKALVSKFINGEGQQEFTKKEDVLLNQIIYSSNANHTKILFEDAPYVELLEKAFSATKELKDLPIKEKAFLVSVLKSSQQDGGELGKSILAEYHNLIQYAKDNRDKLTEPVEATLNDLQIEKYFEKNKTKSIVSLLTAGGHPSRQRLEHRLNKFDKTLDTINYLFHIPELREDLTTICKNQNKVNPAEVIKFFELSKGFLDLGKKPDELKQIINKSTLKEGINIDYMSGEYLQTLHSHFTGGTANNVMPEKWDLSNVYTIPYFLKQEIPEHKNIFKRMFLSTVKNDFQKFIHNPENIFGAGNLKTKELFVENGLDYSKWLNYNKEKNFMLLSKSEYFKSNQNIPNDFKFPKQNEEFAIRVWKRDPQKDLFQGSTAGQCIALDGINCFAGVDELLYSYAQLVEVVNKSKNKPVGNACMYWIKDANNNKALLIDSIGIHAEYENNPQIRKEIFGYIKDYANDVSKEPAKIYIGNQFNKLDVSDLSEPKRDLFKILGDTNGLKSYLDATIAKDRFERYTTIDHNKDYLMEMREII